MQFTRRRFLAISAALAVAGPARATPVHQWRGVALGADASITLAHADAEAIVVAMGPGIVLSRERTRSTCSTSAARSRRAASVAATSSPARTR